MDEIVIPQRLWRRRFKLRALVERVLQPHGSSVDERILTVHRENVVHHIARNSDAYQTLFGSKQDDGVVVYIVSHAQARSG